MSLNFDPSKKTTSTPNGDSGVTNLNPPPCSPEDLQKAIQDHRTQIARHAFADLSPEKFGRHPGRYQEVRHITSWTDVAPLVHDLFQGKHEQRGAIRVKFPESTGADKNSTKLEQTEIRAFLREYHGRPIADIKEALIEKTNNSLTFRSFRAHHPTVMAQDWVTAHIDASTDTKNLKITDIVSIPKPEDAFQVLQRADVRATLTDAGTKAGPIGVIFESTLGDEKHLAPLASALSIVSGHFGEKRPAHVWLTPDSDLSSKGKKDEDKSRIGTSGAEVAAYKLQDFIDTYKGSSGSNGGALVAAQAKVADAIKDYEEKLRQAGEAVTKLSGDMTVTEEANKQRAADADARRQAITKEQEDLQTRLQKLHADDEKTRTEIQESQTKLAEELKELERRNQEELAETQKIKEALERAQSEKDKIARGWADLQQQITHTLSEEDLGAIENGDLVFDATDPLEPTPKHSGPPSTTPDSSSSQTEEKPGATKKRWFDRFKR